MYSLGCAIYTLAFGENPFGSMEEQRIGRLVYPNKDAVPKGMNLRLHTLNYVIGSCVMIES